LCKPPFFERADARGEDPLYNDSWSERTLTSWRR
jgi:hypothetical protein